MDSSLKPELLITQGVIQGKNNGKSVIDPYSIIRMHACYALLLILSVFEKVWKKLAINVTYSESW